MAEHNVGMGGGTMSGGIAIGKQQGQVKATTVHEGGIGNVENKGQAGMIGGRNMSNAVVNMGAGGNCTLTAEELLTKVKEAECLEDTQKFFTDNKITGALFSDLTQWEGLINDLEVNINLVDIRKLNVMRTSLTK